MTLLNLCIARLLPQPVLHTRNIGRQKPQLFQLRWMRYDVSARERQTPFRSLISLRFLFRLSRSLRR